MYTIETRRSVRKYGGRDVPDELLEVLLSKSLHTQTMGNLQLYSVVVTRDVGMKRKLAPAHFNQPMVMDAPVVLTFCADFNRTTRWAECREAHPGYDNFLSFLNASTDALLYCQTFCNEAEKEGLGLCFLGTTLYNPGVIIDVLKLPRLVMPVATVTLGWPAENPPVSDRLPLNSLLHKETYADYGNDDIDRFYSEKESLEENRKYVEINKKNTLAQVFTDIRYTRNDNEMLSESFLKTLTKQGFM